ncbi:MAG: haloacid dehalogenase type II [Rikenellaceae bacterium]|nr:haloacid dehalogenase type II [Rikenellaceae bacterium]
MDNSIAFKKPEVLFFDINETILDTYSLRAKINGFFEADVYDLWFTKLLHYSLVHSAAGSFSGFSHLAENALYAVSSIIGKDMPDSFLLEITGVLSSLPALPDVVSSLEILNKKGYSIVALSNSSEALLAEQLSNADISYLVDRRISAEHFGKYKPHPEVYTGAAKLMGFKNEDCMLAAVHDWDVFGAISAGLKGAYITRGTQNKYYNFLIKPDVVARDLISLSERL